MFLMPNSNFRLCRTFGILFVALSLTGCAQSKQYAGPLLTKDKVAIISGYQGPDMWTPSLLQGVPTPWITHLDGESLGVPYLGAPQSIQVLPGSYNITIYFEHWTKNYCGTLNINVEAGKSYIYYEEGEPPLVRVRERASGQIVASQPLEWVFMLALTCPVTHVTPAED